MSSTPDELTQSKYEFGTSETHLTFIARQKQQSDEPISDF
jgi:hypothetical protein